MPHDPVILGIFILKTGALPLAGRVGGGTEVLQASLFGQDVEANIAVVLALALALASSEAEGQSGEQKERRSEMHLDGQIQVGSGKRVPEEGEAGPRRAEDGGAARGRFMLGETK
jgi:hypothetical protein